MISQLKYLQQKVAILCAKAQTQYSLLAKRRNQRTRETMFDIDLFFSSLSFCFCFFLFSFPIFFYLSILFSFFFFFSCSLIFFFSFFIFFFLLSRHGKHASTLKVCHCLFFGLSLCKPNYNKRYNRYQSTPEMFKLKEIVTTTK